jgi:oligopeptide transport system ATP-binding protein
MTSDNETRPPCLLDISSVEVVYQAAGGRGRSTRALADVSLSATKGEAVGLVGESGCGKSTLARAIVGLITPRSGMIRFKGKDVHRLARQELRQFRRHVQMVFQDPYASLNPRKSVLEIVAEPLRIQGLFDARIGRRRILDLLDRVGLDSTLAQYRPAELSGGQRQRVCIARALVLEPELIVLDEPVSALDVSVQAQILNLLNDLREDLGLTYVFISHDLSVVSQVCDRVAVMYLGSVVETATTVGLFTAPSHPYTQGLLSSIPVDDPRRRGQAGQVALRGEPIAHSGGCSFRSRCYKAQELCSIERPRLEQRKGTSHPAACHFAEARNVLEVAPEESWVKPAPMPTNGWRAV